MMDKPHPADRKAECSSSYCTQETKYIDRKLEKGYCILLEELIENMELKATVIKLNIVKSLR